MIEARHRIVYWAPTRRRHYATLRQACCAEAGAIVKRRFIDHGGEDRWVDDERYVRLRWRLARMIENRFRAKLEGKQ